MFLLAIGARLLQSFSSRQAGTGTVPYANNTMLWWTYQQLRVSSLKTRLAVVQKLAHADSADSVGPLIFALKDREPEVRAAAAQALGKFQSRLAVGPLLPLVRDSSPEVRAAAAETLGRIGDPLAVNTMVGLLLDPAPAVRSAVSTALEKLGWHPGDDSQRVMQILAMGRTGAAASMGAEAVGPLIEMMRTGTPAKQFEAVKALGQIEDPRVKAAMLEALRHENPAIRIAALGTLERLADESTLDAIEKMLKDSSASVRGAAVEAVRNCGRQKALPALLRMLKDPSWEVRQSAVKSLGSLADPAAVPGVTELLGDDDRDVRESAIIALGRIGDRRAVPQLVLALIDKESTVRSAAAVSLRQVDRGWEKNQSLRLVLHRVKLALGHSEYWVRHSAAQLFAQLKIDPETVAEVPGPAAAAAEPAHPAFAILADLLFDHDRDLRLAAATAFGHLHDRNAASILGAAVHDSDHNVHLAVRQALADIA